MNEIMSDLFFQLYRFYPLSYFTFTADGTDETAVSHELTNFVNVTLANSEDFQNGNNLSLQRRALNHMPFGGYSKCSLDFFAFQYLLMENNAASRIIYFPNIKHFS